MQDQERSVRPIREIQQDVVASGKKEYERVVRKSKNAKSVGETIDELPVSVVESPVVMKPSEVANRGQSGIQGDHTDYE
jgi:hypothetical protein